MKLARVIGPVVSTVKHEAYGGHKLLAVQPLNWRLLPDGEEYLAVDTVQAGEGDLVLVNTEGNSARLVIGRAELPMRSIIVAVVDEVDVGG